MKFWKHTVFALLFGGITAQAQQLPQFSGYHINKYIINPAVAGTENYIDMRLHYRKQWTGFENAPETQLFAIHTSFEESGSGLGGYAYNDRFGISKNTGGGLTYAHHFALQPDLNLSFGLSGTFASYGIDGTAITLDNNNDQFVDLSTRTQDNVFNMSFGTYLYADQYWIGVSALQLLPSKPEYFTTATQQFVSHLNVMAGYKMAAGKRWTMEPSVLVNMISGNPTSADFRFYVDYWGTAQFGLGYRTDGALILAGGVGITPFINLHYAYDLVTSNLKTASSGSHEIQLNYLLFYNAQYKKDRKRYKLNLVNSSKDKSKPKDPD